MRTTILPIPAVTPPGRCRTAFLIAALLLSAGAAAYPARALAQAVPPATTTPDAAEDIAFAKRLSKAFKNVASTVEPSVVHITSFNRVRYQRTPFDRPRTQVVPTGLGSGFIVNQAGYIVTNNHVVQQAEALKVKLFDGREFEATVIGRDQTTDLAVIKIDPAAGSTALNPARFGDSDLLDVGEWVVAIGSPFGLSNTVTAGIVSAKGRAITPREDAGRVHEDFIQTDAAINPGNSGGPLLNLQGEVVGVNSAIATRTGGYEGIGFAIPSDIARTVVDNIIANGRVIRGGLGVELTDAPAPQPGDARSAGVLVNRVMEDSPAAKAGLIEGDIITKFQGKALNETRMRTAIAITPPGTKVALEVLRDGKPQQIAATLGDQSSITGGPLMETLGLAVRPATRNRIAGVEVIAIAPQSVAQANDIHVGDLIVAVDDTNVPTAQAFEAAIANIDLRRGCRLQIIRDRMRGYIDIRG